MGLQRGTIVINNIIGTADNENRSGQAFRIAPLIKGNTEQQRMQKKIPF